MRIAAKILALLIPFSLIGFGVWQIHQPSALIVIGIMILVEVYLERSK